MTDSVHDDALLDAYLAHPGPESLAALRHQVRSAPGFRTDEVATSTLGPLLRDGDSAGIVRAGRAMVPGSLLSPSYHLVMGQALRRLGDVEAAEREVALARAAVAGILATGDGTAESPWTILRLSDEYDVLRAQGTRSVGQALVRRGDRFLDRHETDAGTPAHFDVTGMV